MKGIILAGGQRATRLHSDAAGGVQASCGHDKADDSTIRLSSLMLARIRERNDHLNAPSI